MSAGLFLALVGDSTGVRITVWKPAYYEFLMAQPESLAGEWDPSRARGWVAFASLAALQRAAARYNGQPMPHLGRMS